MDVGPPKDFGFPVHAVQSLQVGVECSFPVVLSARVEVSEKIKHLLRMVCTSVKLFSFSL